MKLTVETFQRLKRQVETAQRDYDRTSGALEQINQRLLDAHGCKSLKEAERKLAKLEAELEREEKAFAKEVEAFEQEFEEHESDEG